MCGIVGIIAKKKGGFFGSDLKVFGESLIVDQLRGIDGTGVFFNSRKGGVFFRKAAVNGSDFIKHEEYLKICKQINSESTFVVGHNRYATKGAAISKNCHPFKEGAITLVHNGTLYAHKTLKDVEVDSHAICHAFNERPYKEVIKEINGAMALVWYDNRDKKLRLLRNSERPLCLFDTADFWFFCSEKLMGEWILGRNNIKIITATSLISGTIYEFDIPNLELTTEKVELKPSWVYNAANYSQNYNFYDEDYSVTSSKITNIHQNKKKERPKSIYGTNVEWRPTSMGPHGKDEFVINGIWVDEHEVDKNVCWYTKNKDLANLIIGSDSLVGRISQMMFVPAESKNYYILNTVYSGLITTRGVSFSEYEYKFLPKNCKCCDKPHPDVISFDYLRKCEIIKTKDIYEVTCPDCSDFFDNKNLPAVIC